MTAFRDSGHHWWKHCDSCDMAWFVGGNIEDEESHDECERCAKEEEATPLPEDVARDYEEARAGIDCTDPGTCARAGTALSRLASAAAQVPGLVAELAQRTRERDSEMEERWKVSGLMRGLENRAEGAESERDALKAELAASEEASGMYAERSGRFAEQADRLEKERDALKESLADARQTASEEMRLREYAEDESAVSRARLAKSEQEADAAREQLRDMAAENERLTAQVEAWKENCGLIGSSGDPESVTPAHLSADLQRRDAEAATLTARVAELEQKHEERKAGLQTMQGLVNASVERAEQVEARATAAEASARDLAARCEDLARQCRKAEQRVTDLTETLERKQIAIYGLMETAAEEAHPVLAVLLAEVESILVGLEMAGGDEATLRILSPRDELEAAGIDVPALHARMKAHVDKVRASLPPDSPFYKPAPLTPESLAAVVEGLVLDWRFSDPVSERSAREVLRRALSGNAPRVLREERVVEVLEAKDAAAEDVAAVEHEAGTEAHAASTALIRQTVASIADDLNLALPGGEPTPRAICAPTRQPEVPAAAICHYCNARPSVCLGRAEGEGPEATLSCDDCCGHGDEDGWCRPVAQPEGPICPRCGKVSDMGHGDTSPCVPAEPEVVWEDDTARVLVSSDEVVIVSLDDSGRDSGDKWLRSVLEDVARALAEAKREAKEWKDRTRKAVDGITDGPMMRMARENAAHKAAEAQRKACADAVLAGPVGEEETRGEMHARVANVPLVTG